MSRRLERLNSLLREEISDLIAHSLKDPRVAEMVSVTHVDVSPDLSTARVSVSILGSEEDRKPTLTALSSAAPFVRRELRSRLVIKRVPDLEFEYDDTIERGSHILALIDRVNREREETSS
jgi:ribosome-binding factor A